MRYPEQARMHGIAYLFGVSYYLVLPMTVLPDDVFTSLGGTGQKDALSTAGMVAQDMLGLFSSRHHLVRFYFFIFSNDDDDELLFFKTVSTQL